MPRLEQHFGYPVLREEEPTELAVVPANGHSLKDCSVKDCIILHPRYVPREYPHDMLSARVYRRGRTLDIFMEYPIRPT